jgi:hypothetical protein
MELANLFVTVQWILGGAAVVLGTLTLFLNSYRETLGQ